MGRADVIGVSRLAPEEATVSALPRVTVGAQWVLTAGLAAYVTVVLLSTNYPELLFPWSPAIGDGNLRWGLSAVVVPLLLLRLLLPAPVPSATPRRWYAQLVLGVGVLATMISAASSIAPEHGLLVFAARTLALWLILDLLVRLPASQLRLLAIVVVVVGFTLAIAAILVVLLAIGTTWPHVTFTSANVSFPGLDDSDSVLPRARGLTAYHTILGAVLAIGVPAILLLGGRWRPLMGGVMALGLLCSGSRAAWLAALTGLLVAAIVRCAANRSGRWRVVASVLTALALAGGAAASQSPALGAQATRVPAGLTAGNLAERADAQEIALALWRAHPWLGVGPGNTAAAARHEPDLSGLDGRVVPAHNWLLLALAEGGLLGAAVTTALYVGPLCWLLFIGAGRRDGALAGAWAALAVSQWFDYEFAYWFGGGVLLVLLLAFWAGHGNEDRGKAVRPSLLGGGRGTIWPRRHTGTVAAALPRERNEHYAE